MDPEKEAELKFIQDMAKLVVSYVRDNGGNSDAAATVAATLLSLLVPIERNLQIPTEVAVAHYKESTELAAKHEIGWAHVVAMAEVTSTEMAKAKEMMSLVTKES